MKMESNAPERFPPFATSSRTFFLPKNHPTKTEISKPPSGSNIFAEIQSIKSKKLSPNIFTGSKTPIDNEQRIPKIDMSTVAKIVEAVLFILNSSLKYATTTSNMEMEDVIAATVRRTKKQDGENKSTRHQVKYVGQGNKY